MTTIDELLDNDITDLLSKNENVNCAVLSSGCKLNQFESSQFETIFKEYGLNIAEEPFNFNHHINHPIHLFMLNSCSVTEKADLETKKFIRKIKKRYPLSHIILTGCFAQLNKNEYLLDERLKILNNIDKTSILNNIYNTIKNNNNSGNDNGNGSDNGNGNENGNSNGKTIGKSKIIASNQAAYKQTTYNQAVFNQKRVRPYLKIQEGCDIKCSFCIIPKARPVKWSLDIDNILSSIKQMDEASFKEVVLTGINIGSYKSCKTYNSYKLSENDYSEISYSSSNKIINNKINSYNNLGNNFKDLLRSIEEMPCSIKIRISSIDPIYIDDDLINIFANSKKIQNHYHIPLQSGCDKILKAMKRNYTFNDYLTIVNKIKAKVKNAAIGTDIISGFPDETENDFNETLANLNKLDIYYIHAFSYSDRLGTESYLLNPKVPPQVIKKRTEIIRNISLQKKINYHLKFKNKVLDFLSLPDNKAISGNYIKGSIYQGSIYQNPINQGFNQTSIYQDPAHQDFNQASISPNTLFKGMILDTPQLHSKDEVLIKNISNI
jgi:threonylcarbamoyladenosine tRNA methylthiotransferase MtaB